MMRNPIFESSMKRRMRSFRSPLLLTLYGLFLLGVSYNALQLLSQRTLRIANLRVGIETHIYLTVMQFLLILLVAPALTAGSIAGERERQTLDLLLASRVGPIRIVLGKTLSSLCFLLLLIVSSLPMSAVLLLFGGIRLGDMLLTILFLMMTAFGCCAIGTLCSALLKRTVTATVVAYLVIFALGIGTLLLPLAFASSDTLAAISNLQTADPAASILSHVPLPFFANPGVGLFTMLIRQTGMLRRTMDSLVGYQGGMIFAAKGLSAFEFYNMGAIAAIGAALTMLAACFIKPSGRRFRRK